MYETLLCFVIAISITLLFCDSSVLAKQKEITIKKIESSILTIENSILDVEKEVFEVTRYQTLVEVPNFDLSFKTAKMIINQLDSQIAILEKKNVSTNCKEFLVAYNSGEI